MMIGAVANYQLLLKRVLDDKGKLLLNVTWVNQTIDFGNVSCANSNCSCFENDTCPAMLYSIDEVYNVSEKGEILRLLNVTVYNESFSYSFYMLAYNVEHNQYNLSVVTRIMPINDTNLFMTVVNINPRDDKAQPVADVVFFTNKTTLADHYRLLGNVLNEIRKEDETKWVWNKVRVELKDLAKKVERDLGEYNVEGFGWALVVDDECTSTCGLIWGIASTTLCLLLCGGNPACDIACSIAMGSIVGAACSYWCTGNIDPCSAGCGAFCAGTCSAICIRLVGPELSYFCEKYACVPACTGACVIVC